MRMTPYRLALLACSLSMAVHGQKMVRGVVVDSLTLEHLPGVTVKVKEENRGTTTDPNGVFELRVAPGDTLVFSFVGYRKSAARAQVHQDEEIMFVRMREESFMLKEIVIRDRSLKFIPDKINSPTLSATRPLKAGNVGGSLGVGVNFAYFTRQERDKRKLVAMLNELERIRAYKEIIYNPDFKYEIMKQYSLNEDRYYKLLALFNQGYQPVIRSGNELEIRYHLHYYFGHADKQ